MSDLAVTFRRLHESGCFVIPNPWDVGSARLLAGLGFPALATTSSGFAWSLGRPDNGVSLAEALAHFRSIAASVELPVNGDFEDGFATDPAGVRANVAAAAATGIAGLSIEDSTGDGSHPLFDFTLAVERVRAAKEAIDAYHRGRTGSPRGPADQRRRRPGASGLDRISRGGEGDRRTGDLHRPGGRRLLRRDQPVVQPSRFSNQ